LSAYDGAPRISGPDGFDIVGSHCIPIVIAEVRPHVIDDGGDLLVTHHDAHRRHSVLPVDDHGERISGGFERLVAGE